MVLQQEGRSPKKLTYQRSLFWLNRLQGALATQQQLQDLILRLLWALVTYDTGFLPGRSADSILALSTFTRLFPAAGPDQKQAVNSSPAYSAAQASTSHGQLWLQQAGLCRHRTGSGRPASAPSSCTTTTIRTPEG